MTTYADTTETCAVCGRENEVRVLLSSFLPGGWPDLDTRPRHLRGPLLSTQAMRCESCDYCAPDLEESTGGARRIIEGEAYRRVLKHPELPELARRFMCIGLLEEEEGGLAHAGWSALKAAWTCDDLGEERAAARCRERAVELFRKAQEVGEGFAKSSASEEAILVDLLRRTGRFDQARKRCEGALWRPLRELHRRILEFQRRLIEACDASQHSAGEASEAPESG